MKTNRSKWTLEKECTDILRTLMSKHACLQPVGKSFDLWSKEEAAEIVADLIILIKGSSEILNAHYSNDWGK